MVQRVQHRRFTSDAAGWAPTLKSGELAVNPVRREIALGDTDGTARLLLPVRVHDARSAYTTGDFVTSGSVLYKCKAPIAAHAFNAAEWDKLSFTQAEMDALYAALGHNHDSAYAAIGHNHDSAYAAIGHNHDLVYAAIGHNHDAAYASISHNHDSVYAKLAGSTITGTTNFSNATSIVTTGKVSINAGSSPSAKLHIADNTTVEAIVEGTGTDQQAGLRLKNSTRDFLFYVKTAALQIYDQTASAIRATLFSTGGWNIGAPTGGDKGAGTLNVAAGVYDNGDRLATQAYADSASSYKKIQDITGDAVASFVSSDWGASYKNIRIVLFVTGQSAAGNITLEFFKSGTVYVTSGTEQRSTDYGAPSNTNVNALYFLLAPRNTANESAQSVVDVAGVNEGVYKVFRQSGWYRDSGGTARLNNGGGDITDTGALRGVRIKTSSGTAYWRGAIYGST